MNEGKLTLAAWREFESQFRLIYSRLENPSEEEAQALVLQRLPDTMRKAIIREQTRRDQDAPTVRLWPIQGLTLDRANRMAQEGVGENEPVTVRPHGDSFLIKLYSRRAAERLMMRNGASLSGGQTVKITPHETKLRLEEVFRHAENELRCQEKSDSYGRTWGGRGAPSPWTEGFDGLSVSEVKAQEARPAQPPSAPAQKGTSQPPASGSKAGGSKGSEGKGETPPRYRGRSPGRGRDDRRPSPSPARYGTKGSGKGKGNEGNKGGSGGQHWRTSSPHSEWRRGATPPRSPRGGQPPVGDACRTCGGTDHWASTCPRSRCYECQQLGHLARDCPRGGKGKGSGTSPRRGSA
jgi:hypothetical protein